MRDGKGVVRPQRRHRFGGVHAPAHEAPHRITLMPVILLAKADVEFVVAGVVGIDIRGAGVGQHNGVEPLRRHLVRERQ
jgi:hypothetical protein